MGHWARLERSADPVSGLLRRDFTAEAPDQKWVGDFQQVDTVEDRHSRRMLGYATSDSYPTAGFATDAISMAAATRRGDIAGVIFLTDKGLSDGLTSGWR